MSISQSMLNNLKSIKNNSYGADSALEILREAKRRTRRSEQDIITEMVLFAFENNPDYSDARRLVIDGTSDRPSKARSCLRALSAATGRRQQSLIAEMVIYGGLHNKEIMQEK